MTTIKQYIHQITRKTWLLKSNQAQFIADISVVVPVFNGYEALKVCLQSLLEHTNPDIPIIFLDDASTDQRVHELLRKTEQRHDQVKVVNQAKNMGYLHNVNSFLIQCDNDVVLLNSDTQVTAGWLSQMQLIAADDRVGAVCPLSDRATLLTIKNTKQHHLAQLQQYAGQWYPVPTAVGFCMLIKQAVISALGGFDPYYDPGYGEECDYSMLIRQLGLQVACAPAAFVYHQGSQSFGTSAEKWQKVHQKLLDLRWPNYSNEIALFQSKNPTRLIDLKLQYSQLHKKKILHVLHGIDNKGGVELFTRALIGRFDDRYHHAVLIPERNRKFKVAGENLGFDVIELETTLHQPEHIIFNQPADLYHQDYDLFFQNMVLAGGFDLIHFHSLVGVGTAAWPLICQQLNIPYQLFIHDHFGLCQNFSLCRISNNKLGYCGEKVMQIESDKCQQCLVKNTQRTKLTKESFMSLRKEIWQQIIGQASFIYFPSRYLQSHYAESYPEILQHSMVIKPCFYPEKITPCKRLDTKQINIAFVGQFGELKGAQLFIDFYHAAEKKHTTWHIFGGMDPKYKKQLAGTRIKCHGQFESHQLSGLLKEIDLVVFTSVFPETYAITLTEAWINGKPVLAPNIGAYLERVEEGVNGNLYQFNDLNSLKLTFNQWLQQQKTGQTIKEIQYHEDSSDSPLLIQSAYQKAFTEKVLLPIQHGSLLQKAGPAAWDLMQLWLDAPTTLEAAADWQTAPKNLPVIVLGNDHKKIQCTVANIRQQLTDPQLYINWHDFPVSFKDFSQPCLIIAAGTLINENVGNWIHAFKAQKEKLSTADHALHNHKQQTYHAQFQQRFSWQNHLIAQHFTAGILVDPQIFFDDQVFAALNINNINQIIKYWIQSKRQNIYHFPHHCYSKDDAQWAQEWKKQTSVDKVTHNKESTASVLILLETNLSESNTQKQLSKQTLLHNGQASLISFGTDQKKTTVDQIDFGLYDYIVLLKDNLRFTDIKHLENTIRQLDDSHLDVLSPVTNNCINQGMMAGKKWGAANHFVGIGRIRDLRFDQPESAFEYDILDDDISVFNQAAFKTIREQWATYSGHYESIFISQWLQQAGFATGLCFAKGLLKKGIPSQIYDSDGHGLQQQRQDFTEENIHRPHQAVYSSSFSCRQSCNLDVQLAAFKTPKNLPRIVAYAHDDWASGFYRVKTPLLALAASNYTSVHFLPKVKREMTPTPYELMKFQADTLLLHHFLSDQQLSALIQYKKQTSVRILLGIDDLLTDIPVYSPLYQRIPKDSQTRIKLACSLADGLIVSTEKLAEAYSDFQPNIHVIPNRLSKTIWQDLQMQKSEQHKLRIGWAGAGQHQQDLLLLKPIIEATSTVCDWVFFGDKPEGVDARLYEFHPAVKFVDYPGKLSQLGLDVAVAPLVDNPFNHAKSNLKLLELGLLGVPVIASDLTPYQNSPAILIPNDSSKWVAMIHQLNNNRALIKQYGQTLQNWVKQHYMLEDHLQDWLDVLL